MSDLVQTRIDDSRWHDVGLEEIATRSADCALAYLSLDPGLYAISLLGCDDAAIADLNAEFRSKDAATNVLSWPAQTLGPPEPGSVPAAPEPDPFDDVTELGDIAIAYETCAKEAILAGLPLTDHVCHLVVHGVLHLLGYDHETLADAALMEGIEVEILATMGVKDPYSTAPVH